MAYPFSVYKEMTVKKLNKERLDEEEENYFLKFSDSSIMSTSKKIYYFALLYFKRWYPRFLIHFIITYKVKKALKNENAPETIQNLYREIAKIICLSAMGAYGKGIKVKKKIFNLTYRQYSPIILKKILGEYNDTTTNEQIIRCF